MRPTPSDYKDLDTSRDRNVHVVDGTLVIKNIQKSHEGYYLCKASNGIGGISAVAKIAVQGMYKNIEVAVRPDVLGAARVVALDDVIVAAAACPCLTQTFFLSSPFIRDQEEHQDGAHLREHGTAVRGQGGEAHRRPLEHEQQEAGRKCGPEVTPEAKTTRQKLALYFAPNAYFAYLPSQIHDSRGEHQGRDAVDHQHQADATRGLGPLHVRGHQRLRLGRHLHQPHHSGEARDAVRAQGAGQDGQDGEAELAGALQRQLQSHQICHRVQADKGAFTQSLETALRIKPTMIFFPIFFRALGPTTLTTSWSREATPSTPS